MARKRATRRMRLKRRPSDFPDSDDVPASKRRQVNARLKPRLYRAAWEASKVHRMKITHRVRHLLELDAKACLGVRFDAVVGGEGLSADNPVPASS